MSNLISKKALLKEVKDQYDLNYGEILINPSEFYDLVDGQQIAFDVDKVAEKLEEGIDGVLYDRCYYQDYIFGMDEIKRLIRRYVKGEDLI